MTALTPTQTRILMRLHHHSPETLTFKQVTEGCGRLGIPALTSLVAKHNVVRLKLPDKMAKARAKGGAAPNPYVYALTPEGIDALVAVARES